MLLVVKTKLRIIIKISALPPYYTPTKGLYDIFLENLLIEIFL